jgi:hypothetical protein
MVTSAIRTRLTSPVLSVLVTGQNSWVAAAVITTVMIHTRRCDQAGHTRPSTTRSVNASAGTPIAVRIAKATWYGSTASGTMRIAANGG